MLSLRFASNVSVLVYLRRRASRRSVSLKVFILLACFFQFYADNIIAWETNTLVSLTALGVVDGVSGDAFRLEVIEDIVVLFFLKVVNFL